MKTLQKPGFTLIELLLSAVVFALVGSLAMITIATTVKLQSVNRRSQSIALQAQQITESLKSEIAISDDISIQSITTIEPKDWLLKYSFSERNSSGQKTGSIHYRAICAEPQVSGNLISPKRLIRYTSPVIISQTTCNFINSDTTPKVYLTDQTTAVLNLQFSPVAPEVALVGTKGILMVLTLQYNGALSGSEQRVADVGQAAPPLSFTTIFNRASLITQ